MTDVYLTSDLCEIAYLSLRGAEIAETRREHQNQRVTFIFKGSELCRQLVADIYHGRDDVKLSQAIAEIRKVRGIISRA